MRVMNEKRYEIRQNNDGTHWLFDNENDRCLMISKNFASLLDVCTVLNRFVEENKQLHHELQQIKEYLQTKIDECKNHKKMEEIVFGVEQAVGYEKALLQFQKGLKRRLNNE